MQYTTLGKTGLKVSVAGLGCGGNSRIGLGTGLTEAQSVRLVREALDLGVNFLDTAAAYETEGVVGKAIKGRPRDSVVISTKSHATSGPAVLANLDNSLRQLDTDYVDIFHLHGLGPAAYDKAMAEIVPGLLREKEKGKLRHLAVSETGPRDPEHTMLARAVEEGIWEVFMLGFSMMHQNAKQRLLPRRARRASARSACLPCATSSASRTCSRRPSSSWPPRARCRHPWRPPTTRWASSCTQAGGERRRRRLPLRPPPARHRRRPVRHRQRRAFALQHRLDPAPAAARADVAKLHELFGGLVGVGLDLPDRMRDAKK
jgi:aryl-alcohol dehydrogenase-like predicted oxidoreductase